jgi:hypothetical protein
VSDEILQSLARQDVRLAAIVLSHPLVQLATFPYQLNEVISRQHQVNNIL